MNSKNPLVTIIAICHGQAPYVVETLESIRLQTYPQIELVIINNLVDECESIIREWITKHKVACHFIQNERPLSICHNLNLGLNLAKGEYFQGVSCDDVLMKEKIEKQVKLFESMDKQVACVHCDVLEINKNGIVKSETTYFHYLRKKYGFRVIPEGNISKYLGWCVFVSAPSVLLRREMAGKYDEQYPWEDWQMWLKLSSAGGKFYYINECLAKKRILENSLSHQISDDQRLIIDKMFMKLFFSYINILKFDYYTLLRFRPKMATLLRHSKKDWIFYLKHIERKSKFYGFVFGFLDLNLVRCRLFERAYTWELRMGSVIRRISGIF